MRNKKWMRLPAYVSGSVSQELLLQNGYLARIQDPLLKAQTAFWWCSSSTQASALSRMHHDA